MRRSARLTVICLALVAGLPAAVRAQGDPVRFDALIGLARVKRDAGDPRGARAYFDQARALREFDVDLLDEYFWVIAEADAAAAAEIGERILALRPTNAGVRDRLISAAVSAGDEERAQALALAGEHLMPHAALWPRRLGESLLRRGQAAVAADAFGRAVASHEATRDDRAMYAVALETAGDQTRALAAWGRDGEALCAPRPDWCASRLRAMAAKGDPLQAATAIQRWLASHPNDTEMRNLLVESWARADRPDAAIEALQPLKAGTGATRWYRREYELAQRLGDRARVVASLEALAQVGGASGDERWQLAEFLVDGHEYARARRVIVAAARDSDPCDERPLRMLQHLPRGQASEDFLRVIGVRPPSCPGSAEWRTIAARRATAAGLVRQALELLEPVAPTGALDPDGEALHGQLLLWNGAPDRALPVLERAVRRGTTTDLGESLIEAMRATGQPADAWAIAKARLASGPVSADTRLEWATLAIEAGLPDDALALARSLDGDARLATRAAAVEARALAATGALDEAVRRFEQLDLATLTAPDALAWIDATEALQGMPAALALSERFNASGEAWVEVIARQAMWSALLGPADAARDRRAAVAAVSPARAAIVDGEVALRRERPGDAAAALRPVLTDSSSALASRAADVMSVALAGLADWPGAFGLLRSLMERRPGTLAYEVRDREWTAYATPSRESVAAVVQLARDNDGSALARAAAARVLIAHQRYSEALETMQRPPLTVEERVLSAQCLRALGDAGAALAHVDDLGADPRAALLRASLVAALHGPEAADADFQALASAPDATIATFMAWASAQVAPRARARVLDDAQARFRDNADIAVMRATALRDAGDPAGALKAADAALRLDPTRTEAWVVLVDATVATRGRGALDGPLDRFERVATRDPALVAGLAQQLAGYARTPGDPLIARVLAWLDALLAREPERADVSLAKARLLMAAERWNEALAITDAVIEASAPAAVPGPLPSASARGTAADRSVATALRLRAETLAYRGQYGPAISAFDDYLAVAPDDLGAARLQARTAGWGRRFDESRDLYRALVSRYPSEEVVVAEANAKQAFYDGRWRDAIRQYRRWLELEPGNREAAFELAQSMQAEGDQSSAVAVYRTLADGPRAHRVGADALARARQQQEPSAAPYASTLSSNGYGGQWLLDWNEAGGNVTFAPGAGHRVRVAAEGGAVTARTPGWMRTGYRAGAAATFTPVARVSFGAGASVIDVGQAAGSTVEAAVRASWSVVDRWRALAAFERNLVKENAATVDANLTAQGFALGASFESPRAVSMVRARMQSLSDGNSRHAVEFSGGWTFWPGRSEWRAVTWNQWTGYGHTSPAYFSPSSFWRTDVGLEWRGWLAPMRFRGDRERFVSAGYAMGFDDHGELYYRPAVGVGFEFASGLAFEARGSWLLSDVFDQTDAFIGLRIGGASTRVR